MARARNIKPTFFTNEQLADNCPLGRLFFIGLWTMADYKGDLEWKERTLKIQLLPWDDCDLKSIAINLDKSGLIRFYSDGKKIYINIPNFEKHQNPHKNERDKGSDIPHFSHELRQLVDLQGLTINRDLSRPERNDSHSNPAESCSLNPDSPNLNPDPVSSQATPQAKPAKNAYPDWFEEIWSVYPTRSGGNDKRKALQAANARLKQGRTKQELLEAVKRYRYFVVATGRVSTEYVKMAASFFGPNTDNLDNPWTPPPPGGGGGRTPQKFDPLAYVNRFQNQQGDVIDVTPVSEQTLIGAVDGGERD